MADRKVGIVTGGGQGIGRAIILDLAEIGVDVVAADINIEAAESAAAEAAAAGIDALAFQVNVADADNVEAMVEKTLDKYGRIDYLVNNAGITRDALMMRMGDDAWRAVIDINLTGTYLCSKAVIRTMMKQRSGRIVNISSVVGAMGNAGQTNYSASKAGVIGLTKSLAREVAARGINVNAVAPGFIQTAMTDNLPEKARNELVSLIPNGRLGLPEDVSASVRFLLSDDASYITGQVLHVNGGMYM
ncbi:MAG: 3-oxoacyl-[acyl-carrier-protein] reductase [bacterium]|nr:3-oxoacyl-[acyl-carrier-protein] reductase [bacterium]MDT8394875.1 3-oxoacyl-[acyl-carrier-protein] reductase [bacterium]